MHRRSQLSEAQTARVVEALRRRLQRHEGNVSHLAREIGVPQPTLSRTLNGQHGASLATAEAIARVEGVTVDTIIHAPKERAAQLAREGGINPAAIQAVLDEPEPPAEKHVLWWIDRMRLVAQTLTNDAAPASATTPVAPPRAPSRPRRAS